MNIELYRELQKAERSLLNIEDKFIEHDTFGTWVWNDENKEELMFFITNTELDCMIKTLNKLRKKYPKNY